MHNLKEIRKNFDKFKEALEKRSVNIDFIQLFEINLKNIFIYLKSRLGHLIYYVFRLILKRNNSPKIYIHSVLSIFYPLFHLISIIRGDLSFYENDFPLR